MSSQIRITKTPELDKVMTVLKSKWVLMDEIEIVKMAINKMFQEQTNGLNSDEMLGIQQSQNDLSSGNYTTLQDEESIISHFNKL